MGDRDVVLALQVDDQRVVGLVTPLEGDGVRRQLGQKLGTLEEDVAPKLNPRPALGGETVEGLEKIEVDPFSSPLLANLARASLAEVEGLVAADVEQAAGEAGQELVVEIGQ